jgi:hypothetical protein
VVFFFFWWKKLHKWAMKQTESATLLPHQTVSKSGDLNSVQDYTVLNKSVDLQNFEKNAITVHLQCGCPPCDPPDCGVWPAVTFVNNMHTVKTTQ